MSWGIISPHIQFIRFVFAFTAHINFMFILISSDYSYTYTYTFTFVCASTKSLGFIFYCEFCILIDGCWLEARRDSSDPYKYYVPFFTLRWLACSFSTRLLCWFNNSLFTFLDWYGFLIAHISVHYLLAVLSVDAIDMSGKHEVDLDTNIWKVCYFLIYYGFPFNLELW